MTPSPEIPLKVFVHHEMTLELLSKADFHIAQSGMQTHLSRERDDAQEAVEDEARCPFLGRKHLPHRTRGLQALFTSFSD